MYKRLIRCEDGATAALSAFFILILLSFSALLLDGGLIMYHKTCLDEATAAAAEAVVLAVDQEATQYFGEVVLDQQLAEVYVEAVLNLNLNPEDKPELKTYEIVSCEIDPAASNRIIVKTRMNVKMHFAKLLKVNYFTVWSKCVGKVEFNSGS